MRRPDARRPTLEVLRLDAAKEAQRIGASLRKVVGRALRRRGVVVALSGGVDSAVCAALAVQALGPGRVFGLMLPERDSSPTSLSRGLSVAAHLGIAHAIENIEPTLEAIGCYRLRDEAMRAVLPDYGDAWTSKIAIAGGAQGRFNYFKLVARSPSGRIVAARLPLREYLQIVAATNYKQRIRKTIEYFHADRLNYAVLGTPNRLEYDQGFFVKNGDGSADLKPIAHLYKTQVYALARHFRLPEEICTASPTSDTYSMPQGQDEFYFALTYDKMDLALWAHDHGVPAAELATEIDISEDRARFVYRDIEAKRNAARYLHAAPALVDGEPEVGI